MWSLTENVLHDMIRRDDVVAAHSEPCSRTVRTFYAAYPVAQITFEYCIPITVRITAIKHFPVRFSVQQACYIHKKNYKHIFLLSRALLDIILLM